MVVGVRSGCAAFAGGREKRPVLLPASSQQGTVWESNYFLVSEVFISRGGG